MPIWNSVVKGFSKLFPKAGKTTATWTKTWTANGVRNVQTVSKVAGEAIENGARTVITWGNAAKVAIAGGFTYLFLNGGASSVVSSALGISQESAQILIIFGFIVLMIFSTRYIINYLRSKFNLNQDYIDTPILHRFGRYHWNDENKRWQR